MTADTMRRILEEDFGIEAVIDGHGTVLVKRVNHMQPITAAEVRQLLIARSANV